MNGYVHYCDDLELLLLSLPEIKGLAILNGLKIPVSAPCAGRFDSVPGHSSVFIQRRSQPACQPEGGQVIGSRFTDEIPLL